MPETDSLERIPQVLFRERLRADFFRLVVPGYFNSAEQPPPNDLLYLTFAVKVIT